jgi:transposase-like protein
MVLVPITCPHCGSAKVKQNEISKHGKQRFLCTDEPCRHKRFVDHYTYTAYEPTIRSRLFFSIVTGIRMRARARTLRIAKDTVTDDLRSIEAMVW